MIRNAKDIYGKSPAQNMFQLAIMHQLMSGLSKKIEEAELKKKEERSDKWLLALGFFLMIFSIIGIVTTIKWIWGLF